MQTTVTCPQCSTQQMIEASNFVSVFKCYSCGAESPRPGSLPVMEQATDAAAPTTLTVVRKCADEILTLAKGILIFISALAFFLFVKGILAETGSLATIITSIAVLVSGIVAYFCLSGFSHLITLLSEIADNTKPRE